MTTTTNYNQLEDAQPFASSPPVEEALREYRSLATSINATFANKVRRGIFNPVARYVTGFVDPEDRLQDAIAQTWQLYRRNAEAGRILDDALLVHHCKLRAIDPARSIVPADGIRCQDVYDSRAHKNGTVEVLRLQTDNGDSEAIGLAAEDQAAPERRLLSAIDLEAWVDDLDEADKKLVGYKHLGMSTADVASETGSDYWHTYRRERQLGHELAARAGLGVPMRRTRSASNSRRQTKEVL